MYKKFVVFCDGIIVTQLYEFKKKNGNFHERYYCLFYWTFHRLFEVSFLYFQINNADLQRSVNQVLISHFLSLQYWMLSLLNG